MVILWHTLVALVFNTFQNELKNLLTTKNIMANIFRIQDYDSIICGYFCIGFIAFLFKDKSPTDFTNLFLPHILKKVTTYFWITFWKLNTWMKYICMATSKLISKLDDLLQLKLGKIIETEDFFIAKIDYRGNMSRSFNKYIIALHYANKTDGCFFRCKQECFFFLIHCCHLHTCRDNNC